MRVEESVEIDRPIAEVFEYVSDPQNLPEWSGMVIEVRKGAQGPPTQGAAFTSVAKFLGRRFETSFEVASYDPPRRCSNRSTGGPIHPQEWTRTFEETAGGGTHLTQVVEGEPGGFFRLAGPLLERAGRRQFKTDLENLKELLEAPD
jgi:uncharacterized protein YndB with AHSA1/START domain